MSTPAAFLSKRPQLLAGANLRALAGPVLICMILGMMILPLPPLLLDLLFTFNIALSVMVLLVSMYTMKPLDFAAFPSVLLFSTLLRLSLNVASTRIVLLEGHTGPDAAGQVIEAFGHFLVGGNFAVGIVVFVILMIINFMVITKGAGRIAEVSARFTLDAMPGKQMAIDADLNAGLINEEQAKKRRQAVAQEAEFYGSMDGASKFVRGDAIAGLIIMAINVIGGLIVGIVQHDMSFAAAGKNYTLLTIGDGLVAQIPSLVISTAAGVIVSRVATDQDIGTQLTTQLFTNPRVLAITGSIIVLMGLIPNMPHAAFLLLGGGALALARTMTRREAARRAASAIADIVPPAALPADSHEASWEDVTLIDPLGLEVGYRLIPLVDKHGDGELLKRIKSIRKKFAQEIGFLPPVIHIRDNLELRPNAYRIALKGVEVGVGEAYPGQWLAINPGQVTAALPGAPTQDPAFGLPAVWIDTSLREQAQVYGYTVVDASTVVATHLNPRRPARGRAARPAGSAGAYRAHRARRAVARRGSGAEDGVADDVAKSAAKPARRRRADPRHAHDHRSAVRAGRPPHRSLRPHRRGTARAWPRDHAAMVSGLGRDAGDGARRQSRARAVASARDRPESGPRAGARAHAARRHAGRDAAPAEHGVAARAAGPARAARDARALSAAQPAAIEGAVLRRSAGHARDQGHERHRE